MMEYKPLNTDRNEIRLLTLLPGDKNTVVRCHLEHISLINPPEYRAVSYCWGDPTITAEIIVNETSIPVTTNLGLALGYLRTKGYTSLWVDAICINQQDKTEKNQQLLWMGSIYRRAKEVAAWVGEEGEDSNQAFDILSTRDPKGSVGFTRLATFFARPYWRRVWIIQELALARYTKIHCGQRDINWSTIARVMQLRYLKDSISSPALVNISSLVQFHTDITNIKPVRFIEALKRSSGSSATDPRDRVFALLGLVYDSGLYIQVPNYKQSIIDLSTSMALSTISTTSCLDVIPFLGSGCNNTLGLPSWVPNWFGLNETSARRIDYLTSGLPTPPLWRFHGRPGDLGPWYSVSGDTKPSVSMKSNVLRLRGWIFDEVDRICPTPAETGKDARILAEWQSTSQANAYENQYIFWPILSYVLTRYNDNRGKYDGSKDYHYSTDVKT